MLRDKFWTIATRWRTIITLMSMLFLTFSLAGCMTQDPRLTAALKTVKIVDIRVETAPDVSMGAPLLNGVTRESQVAAVVRILQETLARDLKGYPGGSVATRLIVTLHDVDVSSTAVRIIAGNNSTMQGTIRLQDARTGKLIAQSQSIRATDATVKGGGNLGIIAAIAINAAVTPNQNAVATRLATSFSRQVKGWLTPK